MLRLTVDAAASVDGQNKGRGSLELYDVLFCWTHVDKTTVRVKYSQILKYRAWVKQHDNLSCLYLMVQRDPCADVDNNQSYYIRYDFETEQVLATVLEVLLPLVDVDPEHLMWNATSESVTGGFLDNCSAQCVTTSFLKTHVTCTQFKGNLLLAGVGDSLSIFVKGNTGWTRVLTKQIFHGQYIHGIKTRNDDLIVYGGKKVSRLKLFTSGNCKIRTIYSLQSPDWILDCSLLDGNQIALLTANNCVVLYSLSITQPVRACVRSCVERCILYSGTILGTRWEDIVILAGTVFSTIVVWSNAGVNQSKEIIHCLEGHKGVIFSVVFCSKNRRMCSTSDDRTVRVWEVEFDELDNWNKCAISLKYTLYGHSARVWKCSLLEDGKIVSVGEDSRICVWLADGKLVNQFCGHQDGEIWSLDVSEELEVIATGGSDGGISLWPLKEAQVPKVLKFDEAHNIKPKCVGLLGDGTPFMVTWIGDIFLFTDSKWKLWLSEPVLNSYCVHAISPNRKFLALASITGRIIICQFCNDSLTKFLDAKVCEGRIFSIVWVSNSSMAFCESGGKFSLSVLSPSSDVLQKDADFILPASKERWLTSCATDGNYVVCGDRCGTLYLYQKSEGTKNPVYCAKKIHGRNGVTDVKFLEGKFVSTGRDGKYREFLIEDNKLILLRCCKLKLDWAAAVAETTLLGRVLFCFHEVFFVIWSVKERRPILKIDCGGGHRSWDCSISSERNNIFITYIKGKTVNYCCIPVADAISSILLAGFHPKAINSAELVPSKIANTIDNCLVLLGGEDTTLRLVSLENGIQTELGVLQSHLSSVRAVACHRSTYGDDNLFIASGGGRGQLIVWKLFKQNGLDVVELNSLSVLQQMKTEVCNDVAEMRIMDLKVYKSSRTSVMIAAVCSDGTLRVFSYCVETNIVSEVQVINCSHCLLKVCVTVNVPYPMLISASTSGKLFFHSIDKNGLVKTNQKELSFLVSETGINSCDYSCTESNLIVSCAGDDALVNIVLFVINSITNDIEQLDRWTHDGAHTCQVSGLKMVENWVFTAGLDQQLAIFSWTLAENRISADLLTRVDLCVPDIHGILVWPRYDGESYDIFIYGLGTQSLLFSPALLSQFQQSENKIIF